MAGRGKSPRFFWRSERKGEEIGLKATLFGEDFNLFIYFFGYNYSFL